MKPPQGGGQDLQRAEHATDDDVGKEVCVRLRVLCACRYHTVRDDTVIEVRMSNTESKLC